jgi:DNA polymerase-1
VHELQRGPATRWQWVNYSAYDAKSTWGLHAALEARLRAEPAQLDAAVEADYARAGVHVASLWDVYTLFWRPFGELLTDMEAAGMAVDRPHLAAAEERAVREEADSKARFRSWAAARVPGAAYMNVGSGAQVLQLLFAGAPNKSAAKPALPLARTFKAPNQLPPPEDGKKPKKTMDVSLHSVWGPGVPSPLVPQVHTPAGIPACSTPVLKSLAGRPGRARKALAELEAAPAADDGLEALRDDWDEGGAAAPAWSTNDAEITRAQLEKQEASRIMARSELDAVAAAEGYGRLFSEFGTAAEGLRACAAVDALVDASAIDTLLSNFIVPLQSDAISKPDASGVHRVHCSLNINTETGRLSARRPNLQNQPALEKDRYRVRQAFTADAAAGNTLLVADYGQLELRILAHMAGCQSMITAFRLGGDFHSRTALGMYGHIQEAVASGACLLEWDGAGGEAAPAPLLKDLFGAERRRAKVLNFSIAYGKTAHGLSKDWGVSLKEAEETVRRWYNDRPEVKEWQARQHKAAEERGYVTTLLGRQRRLPDARSANKAVRSHALRAAINTPIQGSAADVATAAMVRINRDARLREMGWRLLLQVHDEVILEGPRESAAEAQARVVACMQSPFSGEGQPLLVDLAVDSKYADTWYDAK